MKVTTYSLKVIFDTPVLGSQPDRDTAEAFIAKPNGLAALPEDEAELLPEKLEKGKTVFHRLPDGTPCLVAYQVLGFLKEAGKVLNGKVPGKVRNLRAKVSQGVFVSPRFIPLMVPEGATIECLSRPLRAETMQGPRNALANSEMLPAETWFVCTLNVLDGEIGEDVLMDLLDYGQYRGLGQWRNSGAYGTFWYVLEQA